MNNIEELTYNGKITSYNFLLDNFMIKDLDKIILITDGISTYGKEIGQIDLNLPIYTIGIGNQVRNL